MGLGLVAQCIIFAADHRGRRQTGKACSAQRGHLLQPSLGRVCQIGFVAIGHGRTTQAMALTEQVKTWQVHSRIEGRIHPQVMGNDRRPGLGMAGEQTSSGGKIATLTVTGHSDAPAVQAQSFRLLEALPQGIADVVPRHRKAVLRSQPALHRDHHHPVATASARQGLSYSSADPWRQPPPWAKTSAGWGVADADGQYTRRRSGAPSRARSVKSPVRATVCHRPCSARSARSVACLICASVRGTRARGICACSRKGRDVRIEGHGHRVLPGTITPDRSPACPCRVASGASPVACSAPMASTGMVSGHCAL